MLGTLTESPLNGNRNAPSAGRQWFVSRSIERLAFSVLVATIMLFAVADGNIGDPARSSLALMLCGFSLLRVLASLISGNFRLSDPVLILPLAGIVGLALLQILPLQSIVNFYSADPFETKGFIVFFSALILAGESLRHLVNNPRRLRLLVGTIITVGVSSAVYGIARTILVPTGEEYAQFINRNHYAVLAEMSTGLLLGSLIRGHLSKDLRLVGWLLTAIIIYSLLTAGSRGGLASLVAMALFSVIVHALVAKVDVRPGLSEPRLNRRAWPFTIRLLAVTGTCVMIVIVSLAAIAFVGGDRVVTRLERVRDEVEQQSDLRMNRGTIWNITIDLIKARPVTGAGFGSYAAAITRFDHSDGSWALEQAHSEYLEILANGGVVGLALFGAFVVLVVKRAAYGLRAEDPLIRSTCFGASIGIFGVLIHSLVDYGLHVPINALICVVLVVIATNGWPRAGASLN